MTIEEQLRTQFDEAIGELAGPDLESVLTDGRRRRVRRIASLTTGSVAATAAVALAITPLVHNRTSAKPVQPATSSHRAVSSNPVGQRLQAAVAAADPQLPAPSQVYPSDWNRNAALPESQAANATEWQLVYQLPEGETVRVDTSRKIPGQPADATCPSQPPAGAPQDNPPCHTTRVSGGTLLDMRQQGVDQQTLKPVNTQFFAMFVASDGSVVSVTETVPNADQSAAVHARALTDAQLDGIATAQGMGVPAPRVTPPPPTGA